MSYSGGCRLCEGFRPFYSKSSIALVFKALAEFSQKKAAAKAAAAILILGVIKNHMDRLSKHFIRIMLLERTDEVSKKRL
jgi:hypothetical protein